MRTPTSNLMYDKTGVAHVTMAEAARRKEISRVTIRKHIDSGLLPHVILRGYPAISITALNEYHPDRAVVERARRAARMALVIWKPKRRRSGRNGNGASGRATRS